MILVPMAIMPQLYQAPPLQGITYHSLPNSPLASLQDKPSARRAALTILRLSVGLEVRRRRDGRLLGQFRIFPRGIPPLDAHANIRLLPKIRALAADRRVPLHQLRERHVVRLLDAPARLARAERDKVPAVARLDLSGLDEMVEPVSGFLDGRGRRTRDVVRHEGAYLLAPAEEAVAADGRVPLDDVLDGEAVRGVHVDKVVACHFGMDVVETGAVRGIVAFLSGVN